MDTELKDLNRDQLNDLARDKYAEQIPDPTAYGNKGELVAAIEAAQAGEPVPEPKPKTSGGATVTFKGCEPEPNVRSVRVGDHRFPLDVPVDGIDSATLDAIGELDGYEFDVE